MVLMDDTTKSWLAGLFYRTPGWWYVFWCAAVVLLIRLADLSQYYLGIRSVYWPILGFWLLLKLESWLVAGKLKCYFEINSTTVRLNCYLMLFFLIIFGAVYFAGLYPQGDLLHLNRGVPNWYFPFVYALFSVPIQQDLVFGELYDRLDQFGLIRLPVLATFYSLIHIFYPQPELILLVTFGLGMYWAYARYYSQSIFGNLIAHTTIGLAAFALNFA